ncbi:exonuclease SbcCD subunit D C-terminal domain-containing protein, partial [Cronobacter sakazakii]
TGHLTTVGVTKSDAVRDIYIGTLDAFPADRFPPADYIALGHIHRAQKVAGCEHIRYSGSPIALSFDETGKEKSVYLVEFADGKLRDVTALPVPVSQPLAVLKGSLESITAQLEQWRDAPDEPKVWLDIEIDTGEFLHDMHRQISQLTESLPVEVVLLRRSREMRERALGTLSTETLSELGPEEVFERRLELESLEEPEKARLRTLFARTLESLHEEDEA